MKKMPPPGKVPPNGSGSSPHNGRAEELSHGERIAQLEVLIQNCATKTDLEMLRTEMAELRAEMAEFKGEMKTEIAALNGRIDTLDEKMTQMQENMATKADLLATENRILRWMVGSMISIVALVVVLLRFL